MTARQHSFTLLVAAVHTFQAAMVFHRQILLAARLGNDWVCVDLKRRRIRDAKALLEASRAIRLHGDPSFRLP